MSRHFVPLAVAAAVATAAFAAPANALPVIPGAKGYGMETPAGRGGTIYKVTNLNASGSGSLAACALASGPRVCIFEVSGVIKLDSIMEVRSPYLTIAGQTAPSPGIMIRGAPLVIATSDVLVQHLRFRTGDAPDGPDGDLRDSLSISQPSKANKSRNIVFDHNSIQWGVDELMNVWGYWDNVTLNNNMFAEPLNDSIHPDGPHGYGPLFTGWESGNISLQGNLFAHINYRAPATRAPNFVFINNVIYNRGDGDISLSSDNTSTPVTATIIGNMFLKGPNYKWNIPPIFIDDQSDANPWPSGSRIYETDNVSDEPYNKNGAQGLIARYSGGSFLNNILSSLSSIPLGIVPKKTANNGVLDSVLANTGARPADRDATDKRIINTVKTKTGQIINCVASDGSSRCSKNAGGWPTLAENRRTLNVPANPHAVASNGYTNLENWLHQYAAEVEGVATTVAPLPPTNVSIQ
jgi:hypothetical protein